jgi:hypothetical protein
MTTKKTDNPKSPRKKAVPKEKKVPLREEKTDKVIQVIENEGLSLTRACKKVKLARSDFHEVVNNDAKRADEYARAREKRAELYLEETIEIADDETQDKTPFYGAVKVKRDQLRIDARLKYLATMYPKKYGNKLELSGDKENPLQVTVFQLPDNKRD